jgi:hypothetical protein
MLIESTIYVNMRILGMLNRGAAITGRSRTYMIKILMQRVMRDDQKLLKFYSRIKYQERDLKENWHRLHIVLNEYEYEYYLDMRKFFKMSVSFILAYAVIRYLDELLKMNESTDNYCYKNYVFIKQLVNGIICWQTYWGIPPNLTTS